MAASPPLPHDGEDTREPTSLSTTSSGGVADEVAEVPVSATAAEPIPDPDEDLKARLRFQEVERRRQIQQDQPQQHQQAQTSSSSQDPQTATTASATTSDTTVTADVEKQPISPPLDIEHLPVEDDPRLWSARRKWGIVAIVSGGALVPALAANMFFPAIDDIEEQLGATESSIAWALSSFIIVQGLVPLIWSPVSELIGRKICFMVAMATFAICSGFTSLSKNVATLIVLRALAAGGSSACLAIAGGTLADIYEAEERGVVVGIYYSFPVLGPAIAPVIGGGLTEAAGWKAVFWFLGAAGAASFIGYALFRETFRRERSAAWQKAREHALKKAAKHEQQQQQQHTDKEAKDGGKGHHLTGLFHRHHGTDEKQVANSDGAAPADKERRHVPTVPPNYHGPGLEFIYSHGHETHAERPVRMDRPASASRVARGTPVGLRDDFKSTHQLGRRSQTVDGGSLEQRGSQKQSAKPQSQSRPTSASASSGVPRGAGPGALTRAISNRSAIDRVVSHSGTEIKFKPSLWDVSPLGSATIVLSQPHNLAALFYGGMAFAAQYSLSFTATQTFTAAPYNLSPILIGCLLLSLGVGGVLGSILGGRISDARLRRIARETGHRAAAEERLKTIYIPLAIVGPAYAAYGWTCQVKTNIGAPIVLLFIIGYAQIACYSTCLSYLVDSNPGRSSGAVAVNSAFRGIFAFVSAEVSTPILDAVGNGPMQSGFAVLIVATSLFLVAASRRGGEWRDDKWTWPKLWKQEEWKSGREGGVGWIREQKNKAEAEAEGEGEGGS